MTLGPSPWLDPPCLVFINVYPQVEWVQVAEQDEWRCVGAGGGELSGSDLQLKHRGVDGG